MKYEYYVIDESDREQGPFFREFADNDEAITTLRAEGLFLSSVAIVKNDGTERVIYCPWG